MVKATLALLALAGPAFAGVINERGGGHEHWGGGHEHSEKPHHSGKPHHPGKPHHSGKPTPSHPETTVSVTKPHWYTKTTTYTTTDCPGKLSST